MTDHKAAAEALMSRVNESGFAIDPEGSLVHATLYLAEQQRIANLIAYGALVTAHNSDFNRSSLGVGDLHVQIRDALGIT